MFKHLKIKSLISASFIIALLTINVKLLIPSSIDPNLKQGVAKACFTSAIVDRNPVDDLSHLSTEVNKIYFFSEIQNMEGNVITHRWIFNGNTMAEKSFEINGPRWRINSSKNLIPEWTGEWKVQVIDSVGNILLEDSFEYIASSQPELKTQSTEQETVSQPQPEVITSAKVARAVFTTGISDREPIDEIEEITTATKTVYFFSEIIGMKGKTVSHRWIYKDQTKAKVPFQIAGSKWRIYSSKNLMPEWIGTWIGQVVDDAGNILHQESFSYRAE